MAVGGSDRHLSQDRTRLEGAGSTVRPHRTLGSAQEITNTSLETAVFVDRVLERLETPDVLIRPLAMPQEHTEGCLERCGDEPARDDPDRLGGDAAGSLFQRRP